MTTDEQKSEVATDSLHDWLDEDELDALVFSAIRSNQDKSKRQIIKTIKECVPKRYHHQLSASLERLI